MRELTMCPAERYDMILRPRKPGVVRVKVETLHWITGKVLGSAETLITVSGQALPDPPPNNPPGGGASNPYPSAPQPAPAAQPAPGPARPAAPRKPSAKGKKVTSTKRTLSLRERLRRCKRLKAKAKPKKGASTAGRKPARTPAAKTSSRKRRG